MDTKKSKGKPSSRAACSVSLCRDCSCCGGAIVIGEITDGQEIRFPDSQQLNRCPHCDYENPLE